MKNEIFLIIGLYSVREYMNGNCKTPVIDANILNSHIYFNNWIWFEFKF